MKLRKTQLSYRLKKMNENVRKDGKIWNTGVALLKYFAGLNSNQNGQYGQIYAEKFTSACLICKVFYGKMKAQWGKYVEAQTAFNPGYPLTKRAIYYCSRMISAQHGPIFTNSEYGKIRKVYSIWVCTHPTKEFQNTLIRYSIRPEQLIGNAVEKSENYDLMSVVTICLGESGTENYTGIVKFMDVLLSSSRAATEKKKILEEEFGVAMNEELEREVLVMCNLSQGVKAEGREEGINIGEMRMLVKQVRKGRVTIEEAAEDAGMTVEEFKKVMENTPLQAV